MNPYSLRFQHIFLKILLILGGILLVYGVFFVGTTQCGRNGNTVQVGLSGSPLVLGKRIHYECQGKIPEVTGIILHFTDTDTMDDALAYMENRQLYVPLLVDKDGTAYQLTDSVDDFPAGATGGNSWGINIEIVGNHESLLMSARNRDKQFFKVVEVVRFLVQYYGIPVSDDISQTTMLSRGEGTQAILQWHGIFSHEQVDGFHPQGGRRGKVDPGDEYMRSVFTELKRES